jgi:hypothetical protein
MMAFAAFRSCNRPNSNYGWIDYEVSDYYEKETIIKKVT